MRPAAVPGDAMDVSGSYYDRSSRANSDGTQLFATRQDARHENDVAARLGVMWSCQMQRFAPLCPVDWYATRHGRMAALVELKSRSHERGRYPTVFLNARKWLALTMGSMGFGVPAVFVVRWTDALGFVLVGDIDASRPRIGGCSRIVKSRSDIEPVIEVPIDAMKLVPCRDPLTIRRAAAAVQGDGGG
jgi:hypothetical protein